jgi:hypothetical protein
MIRPEMIVSSVTMASVIVVMMRVMVVTGSTMVIMVMGVCGVITVEGVGLNEVTMAVDDMRMTLPHCLIPIV